MDTEVADRAREAEARAALYLLLARGFTYPNDDSFASLLREDVPAAAETAELLGDDVASPLTAFAHRLAHTSLERLARDFERIFTHGSSVDWPPNETAYTAKGIFQQANDLADVAGFYAAYGTEVSEDAHEPPDHVSVELEFMYLLAFKEAYALRDRSLGHADACRADQARFVADHLGRWVAAFAGRLARGAAGSPYADLAELCAAFVAQEAARLGASPAPVDGSVFVEEPVGDGCELACVFRGGESREAQDA